MINKTVFSAVLALLAFASNSLLGRWAFSEQAIDAGSFTLIRLLSAIAMLVFILIIKRMQTKSPLPTGGSWSAAFMLFLYAITFSYAYQVLSTGTGALILYAAVQISMITVGFMMGERLHKWEWLGLSLAFGGFVYLVLPEVTSPSLKGVILMAISGSAWGMYTVLGRNSQQAIIDTAYNFIRTLPFLLLLLPLIYMDFHLTQKGLLLAVISGALTSACGYILWYLALPGLTTTTAAASQLLVPPLAAAAGVLMLDEPLSWRLIIASLLILGGILVVILGRSGLRFFNR
ncbi:MAG: DMT family transporter [Pseudomonadales bacterium]|nr:DMT family transporter [Pseudomonadales bacterium]